LIVFGYARENPLPKWGRVAVLVIHPGPYRQKRRRMIVGVVLAGGVIGAVAALVALLLGQGVWMALLIYSGTGILAVLACAALSALRTDPASGSGARSLTPPQRG
jgi:uncharacterized membrane protein YkgB